MALDSDQGERTEEATQQRREDFRKRGQVAQPRELGSVFVLFAVFASAQQQDFSKVEEQATPLGHDMFAITGAGGNFSAGQWSPAS